MKLIDEAKDEIKEEVPFAELDPSQQGQILSDHNECKKLCRYFANWWKFSLCHLYDS